MHPKRMTGIRADALLVPCKPLFSMLTTVVNSEKSGLQRRHKCLELGAFEARSQALKINDCDITSGKFSTDSSVALENRRFSETENLAAADERIVILIAQCDMEHR